MTIILMALLGAFLWRIRGGLLNSITGHKNWLGIFNDTGVRIVWSVGMADALAKTQPGAGWLGSAWHLSPHLGCGLTAVALFAGTTDVGWFGADLLPTKWRDIGLLTLSGILRMAPVALGLFSPWPLVAGLLFGPAYWLGARIPQKPGGWDFWGEWITGAVIGACLGAM